MKKSARTQGELWRRIENTSGFEEGMERAAEQFATGQTVPLRDLYRGERRRTKRPSPGRSEKG